MTASELHIAARGAVSCFGVGHDTLIESIFRGDVGLRPLERLAGTNCLTEVVAEVPAVVRDAVDVAQRLPFHMAVTAAREALARPGLMPDHDTLLVLATTKADMGGIETPAGQGLGNPIRLAGELSTALELEGPTFAVSAACASGLSALALAGRKLRAGVARRALVVGVDSVCPFILRGFSSLLALSRGPCQPFDADRSGLSLGDGAGAILLSSHPEESTGWTLRGWGESNDANHITGPSRDGKGLATAIERALCAADTPPAAIDFVHLHGTGTLYNDKMEGKALQRVFEDAAMPPGAGSKGQIGHTLGAAGILESLITLAALERGTAPGTGGMVTPDPQIPIPVSPHATELPRANAALKIAAGFGGIDAALVFGRRVSA